MSARPASSRRAAAALVIAVALLGFASRSSLAADARPSTPREPAREPAAPAVLPHRVVAYYFHTTQRCASCRAIEAYSREAIEKAFAAELADGRLVWRVVNIEDKGNEHFVKDYGLYTKSVVLVNEVRGRPAEWKQLERVWQLLQDKPKFVRYVQDETRAYLADPS